MGIKFGESAGEAKKGGVFMTLEEGSNRFRMVGDICPRYQYWIGPQGANRPFECLAFNREQEKFTNVEKDWIIDRVPTQSNGDKTQCSWAYAVQVIDRKDGKLKVLNLKKKMFMAIINTATKLNRDPTNLETGFDIVVDRIKTGPKKFNVAYELDQFAMMEIKDDKLSDEDLALVENLKDIDDLIPRPTSDEQKAEIDAFLDGSATSAPAPTAKDVKEAISELEG
jgi:hypothetical protein